jgi:hypothetical protein
VNWNDVVPTDVADSQAAWERVHRVLRARQGGARTDDIAKVLRVSRERVRQMELKARRWPVAPVLRFCDESVPGLFAAQSVEIARGRLAEATKAKDAATRAWAAAFDELRRVERAARFGGPA